MLLELVCHLAKKEMENILVEKDKSELKITYKSYVRPLVENFLFD